jgi:putative aldouronate transport system permease protein
LSALSSVDPELHESAQIDGASRLARLYHIDLATILPTVSIMLILRFGQLMSVGFEKIYLMQNSINQTQSEVISTYIYKVGLATAANFSYGAAIGMFNSIINCAMLIVVNAVARKIRSEESSLW